MVDIRNALQASCIELKDSFLEVVCDSETWMVLIALQLTTKEVPESSLTMEQAANTVMSKINNMLKDDGKPELANPWSNATLPAEAGKSSAAAKPSIMVMRTLQNNNVDLTQIASEQGFIVGVCVKSKGKDGKDIDAKITKIDSEVHLQLDGNIVRKTAIEAFLKETWKVFTPKDPDEKIENVQLISFQNNEDWRRVQIQAAIMQALKNVTNERCTSHDLRVFSKPKNVLVSDSIATGGLVLVPTTPEIKVVSEADVKDQTLLIRMTNVVTNQLSVTTKDRWCIVPYTSLPSKEKETSAKAKKDSNTFFCNPFFFVGQDSDEANCNMKVCTFADEGISFTCMKNTKALQKDDKLVLFVKKDSDDANAPKAKRQKR
jgi:hypoxanthine phosphoribosyltransferase